MFHLLKDEPSIIRVIGVGGGGSNAVNFMFRQGIVGVDFAVCNTDAQALNDSPVPTRIHLGPSLTEGRGAGSNPPVGKQAAIESMEEIKEYLHGAKMLFVTAGMGGGTGTGAAPIIAKTAKDMGILTVGIVTLPFTYEGKKRVNQGFDGLDELKQNTDAYVVISNDKLRTMFGNLTLSQAFIQSDLILTTAAKGIAEIITRPGTVNVDFEDVNTVMRGSGMAIMGCGTAEGENRARRAADEALNSPLLEENNILGAKNILINISSGTKEMTMEEMFEITNFIQDEAGGADLIWGHCSDDGLGDKISVTVIATGFEHNFQSPYSQAVTKVKDTGRHVSLDSNGRTEPTNAIEFDTNSNRVTRASDLQRAPQQERPRVVGEPTARFNRNAPEVREPLSQKDFENVPAYVRRKMQLEDSLAIQQAPLSAWTLSEEGQMVERRNPFLDKDAD